jgi:hypothetical protein
MEEVWHNVERVAALQMKYLAGNTAAKIAVTQ